MKKVVCFVLLLFLLTGCRSGSNAMDRAICLRQKLCDAQSCSFTARIVADYSDRLYEFTLGCKTDGRGNMAFSVLQPQSISGITGTLTAETGFLTFDDQLLAFPQLADGYISPVCAPFLLIATLRGGYIQSCVAEEGALRITLNDTFAQQALQLDVWLREEAPVYCEIAWDGKRILSVHVTDFVCV